MHLFEKAIYSPLYSPQLNANVCVRKETSEPLKHKNIVLPFLGEHRHVFPLSSRKQIVEEFVHLDTLQRDQPQTLTT